ncbi:transporter [Catalinimonas niigatensis]|uniref:transporter n=1 Tax=Catalinimonas niigatensis TaxID=1397264 RepID=UPI002664F243|nr:transporter [Catalinimonas niigatensis]WPP52781.1 transporter [Catalinimonas niigatensis]
MKKIYTLILFTALLFYVKPTHAQTPTDALMMNKRELCFALMYEYGSWDQYWEGTYLRSNATVATLNRNMLIPMVAIGITDKVNLIATLPYVETHSSEPNGGRFAGAKGFQDLGLALKTELLDQQIGKGKLSLLTTLGFSTPTTNYLSDYRPYSIGNGTHELNFRGIAQYQWDQGIYVRGSLAHLWRGQTKAERDYYYNNGSYYTPWMDVPNAWNYDGVLGIWMLDNALRMEVNYMGLRSTSGDDIRRYNAGQPTNKVDVDQLGFFSQYYFKKLKGLGVLGYYSQIVHGRNMGKFSSFGLGATYQFSI